LPTTDDILRLLENGKWHNVKEIIGSSGLHNKQAEIVISFLSEHDFVELDKRKQKMKLTPSVYNFVKRINDIEEKEAAQ
jgi:predicted transcriptional regulator